MRLTFWGSLSSQYPIHKVQPNAEIENHQTKVEESDLWNIALSDELKDNVHADDKYWSQEEDGVEDITVTDRERELLLIGAHWFFLSFIT